MADLDINKANAFFAELESCTDEIRRKKMFLDANLQEIKSLWMDETFQKFNKDFSELSTNIGAFISQSKKIQEKWQMQKIPLMRYLN